MKIKDIEISWLGHAGFKIKTTSKTIYIDPYQIAPGEKADIILITHGHFDHCSIEDIRKIIKPGTKIFCTPDCQSTIAKIDTKVEIQLTYPEKEFCIGEIKIKAIPSYNTNKKFHSKNENYVGYLIQTKEAAIYHAGDTDLIKEMQYINPRKEFVVLLPVGGTYTMNAEEAAKAAGIIKPSLAIPMHYGSIVGSPDDAKKFVELCKKKGIRAEILEKE
ncbi:MAG: MBL fold metallo-hydrolase [Candidatus Pacearchaeota archaeon]|nr:MBL fold metallo-hydrolase [Candidatus Pacearchaeota archaeon]